MNVNRYILFVFIILLCFAVRIISLNVLNQICVLSIAVCTAPTEVDSLTLVLLNESCSPEPLDSMKPLRGP